MTDRREFEVKVEAAESNTAVPDWERRLYIGANWLDARLGVRFWILTGLVVGSLFFGTPHVLVHYRCYGRCGQNATEFNCQYFGISGWRTAAAVHVNCARIRLM